MSKEKEETSLALPSNSLPTKNKKITMEDVLLGHFFTKDHFYNALLRRFHKNPSDAMKFLAAISLRGHKFYLSWNPEMFGKLSGEEAIDVCKHEALHVVFSHLTSRSGQVSGERNNAGKSYLINIAQDLAINSFLPNIPKFGFKPGRKPQVSQEYLDKVLSKETEENQKKFHKAMELVEKLPEKLSWPDYYTLLKEDPYFQEMEQKMKSRKVKMRPKKGKGNQKGGGEKGDDGEDQQDGDGGDQENGEGGGGYELVAEDENGEAEPLPFEMDLHGDSNDPSSDAIDEWLIRDMLQEAINVANSSNAWGSVPTELRQQLEALLKVKVDWWSFLKAFVGKVESNRQTSTYRRVNRRMPYQLPGTKRERVPRIVVAVDESGSVSNEQLQMFFGGLNKLAKLVEFWVLPFDAAVNEEGIIHWKRGQRMPDFDRVSCGGTDFNVPTQWVNENYRKLGIDGLIICTDGECCKPVNCILPRAWVLAPECNLPFEVTDLVIKMKDER